LPITSDTMTSPAPAVVSQRLTEFMNGKATSRAPICCGTTILISPVRNGIAMKKIMMVPCELKIWSKCSGGR
jgi:hypothetical protein